MCPSGSRAVSQKVNFCGQGNTGASPRLPLGEERANILLLTCCYQEGSKVAAVEDGGGRVPRRASPRFGRSDEVGRRRRRNGCVTNCPTSGCPCPLLRSGP